MSRIKLLQPQEIILFNQAPLLDLEEKSHFFSLTSPFDGEFKELRDGYLTSLKIEKFHIVRDFYFIQRHGTDNMELNKLFIRFCKKEA